MATLVFGMRLSRLRRLAALLLVGWVPLVANGGQLAHGCEAGTHVAGTRVAGTQMADAVASAGEAHAAHAAHVAHAQQAAHAELPASATDGPTAPPGHHAADCRCVGACCPSAVAALAAPSLHALPTVRLLTATAPGRPAHAVVAAWVDFVLPFATAPPVSLRS